jgi:phosphatidylserine/phosphatidylglycerophosphate/cardiolipin synthase-like enzyme
MNHRPLRYLCALTLLGLLGAKDVRPAATAGPAASEDNIAVFFSPDGGCADAIVAQLAAAKKFVHMQAYFFSSPKIAKAVLDAQKRKIEVGVIVDKSVETANYSSADFLANAGVATYVDSEHAIAHNKVILIDGQIIITGSFNFTASADTDNAENLLVLANKPKLYAAFEKNFQEHLKHSKKYKGKAERN